MNNINLVKEITETRETLKKLEEEKLTELWKQFPSGVVLNIYKELCKYIPELRCIPAELLLDRSVHPFQNKQLIIKKLRMQVRDKKRMNTIIIKLNEIWNKLLPLWNQIDVKYMPEIHKLESRLQEIEYNNSELDDILKTYEKLITTSNSIYELEKSIKSISDIGVKNNILELFRNTEDIAKIAVKLN
jgi:hypothetical protein